MIKQATKNQQIVILIATIIIFLMGLFPPVLMTRFSKVGTYEIHGGYSSILTFQNFPTGPRTSQKHTYKINIPLLFTQWFWVVFLASGAYIVVTFKKKGESKQDRLPPVVKKEKKIKTSNPVESEIGSSGIKQGDQWVKAAISKTENSYQGRTACGLCRTLTPNQDLKSYKAIKICPSCFDIKNR